MRRRRVWPAWARPSDIADLLRLSGPIAVSRAAMMLMGLTDVIVLGQNAPGELPFVLNSWLPIGVSLGLTMGLLMGVSVLTAELAGVGNAHNSGRIFRRGVRFSLWFGAVLTLLILLIAGPMFRMFGFEAHVAEGTASVTRILAIGLIGHMLTHVAGSYLEALRRPLIVTAIMYAGVIINLVIDLAVVAGWWGMPKMGADGVAIATTGTRWVLVIFFLVAVWKLTPAFRPSADGPPREAKRQFSVGYGTAVSNVAEWGGFNSTFIIATLISTAVNTIYGMAVHVIGFCFMAFLGLGTATSVRVAEAYGRKNTDQVREASRLGVVATVMIGIALGALVWIFQVPLASILIKSDAEIAGVAIHEALVPIIGFTSLVIVFDGLQNVASMAMRAQNVIWPPTFIHLGSYFVIMLPLAWYLGMVQDGGAMGMMQAVLIASLFAGLMQTMLLEMTAARRLKPTRRQVI
ncbi:MULTISPECIES: MATE family efflux transporter [Henriciella]|jgi:multidrug resistance protein, MATE family|uniref:Multidrug resistance protein NorM n=1 Tax=Henriciella pelagia TaxID=1977912 RepID=A0ABQ1J5M0_9PROT|nr:MATE family efflux transporter [Henriciella pelagia]GGB60234.1 multidrug resistance protein NorM [Henriciella pelagia]